MTTPVTIILTTSMNAGKRDDAIYVNSILPWVSRGRVKVRMSRRLKTVVIMLCARSPRIVTNEEIFDTIYGGRRDGGPEYYKSAIEQLITGLKDVGAALGFVVRNEHGRGWWVQKVEGGEGEIK